MVPIVNKEDLNREAADSLKENPQALDKWRAGVTTLDGKPELPVVKAYLGMHQGAFALSCSRFDCCHTPSNHLWSIPGFRGRSTSLFGVRQRISPRSIECRRFGAVACL